MHISLWNQGPQSIGQVEDPVVLPAPRPPPACGLPAPGAPVPVDRVQLRSCPAPGAKQPGALGSRRQGDAPQSDGGLRLQGENPQVRGGEAPRGTLLSATSPA